MAAAPVILILAFAISLGRVTVIYCSKLQVPSFLFTLTIIVPPVPEEGVAVMVLVPAPAVIVQSTGKDHV